MLHLHVLAPAAPADAELVIKKSRFLALLRPAHSAEEAERWLADIRAGHRTANHHCYAWRLGPLTLPAERFSDAGEPSGTAGRPILEVMRRQSVCGALLVVVRYFGGILLGANGLVRAYTDAAAAVLAAAQLWPCHTVCRLQVACDYSLYGRLLHELAQLGAVPAAEAFSEQVHLTAYVPAQLAAALQTRLRDASHGQADLALGPPEPAWLAPDGRLVPGPWPAG
ncbi:MAG: IMPACT family protein [Alicyclobacillus sp.]|nr:IMPACT family protein [Alicyclobacillus sp.]